MSELNHRQQAFVDEYLIDMNATQAAIRAGYSKKTAQEQSSRLLSNVIIAEAIKEQQKVAQKRRQETLDDILNELDENRRYALMAETVQSSAATAATMAKAKLLGYVVDQTKLSGDKENPVALLLTQINGATFAPVATSELDE